MAVILFQDEHLVAVHKRSGQFVHATNLDRTAGVPLLQELRDQLETWVYPVHRIDRGASGLVLLALSTQAAAAMNQLFTAGQVNKQYLALVRGFCSHQTVDRPLQRKGRSGRNTSGELQDAVTTIRCLQRYAGLPASSQGFQTSRCCLVQASPETGRFHQIRRHLNGVSHPILGDSSHGDTRQNRFFRDQFGLCRLMLAAWRLSFRHPLTLARIEIECPPADDFQQLLNQLEAYRTDAVE